MFLLKVTLDLNKGAQVHVSFHQDPVNIGLLCADLNQHGAVHWHTTRPNFKQVRDLVKAQGLTVLPLCARPGGDFLNFMILADLADDELAAIEERVAQAIERWQYAGEPVPHHEPI